MAEINFWLKNPNGEEETLIYLFFSYKGNRLKFSTGWKAVPHKWTGTGVRGNASINANLARLKQDVLGIYARLEAERKPIDNQVLRKELALLDATRKPQTKAKKPSSSVLSTLEEFIQERKDHLRSGSLQRYTALRKHLTGYQQYRGLAQLHFDGLTGDFYSRFLKFLQMEVKVNSEHNLKTEPRVGLQDSTVGKLIVGLKVFLNWCTEQGIQVPRDYKKFRIPGKPTEIIALSEDELLTLIHLDLSKNLRLQRVRDLFVFGCLTGLRFSDLAKIEKANVKGRDLVINTQKTRDRLSIPLSTLALGILEKYKYRLPAISNQNLNSYLKELGQVAEMNDRVMLTEYRGPAEQRVHYKKWELLTTHAARRTFITLSLEKGMRPEVVMSITGHKDFRTMKPYIKISDRVKAQELKKAWNFDQASA